VIATASLGQFVVHDTPNRLPRVDNCYRQGGGMAKTYLGGRPSKGPRKQLPARLPLDMATEIEDRATALEISVTEYLVRALGDHLASTPRPDNGQGALLPYNLEGLSKTA
jgi:hypothetical protein